MPAGQDRAGSGCVDDTLPGGDVLAHGTSTELGGTRCTTPGGNGDSSDRPAATFG